MCEPLVRTRVPLPGWVTWTRQWPTSAALILLGDYGDDLHEERGDAVPNIPPWSWCVLCLGAEDLIVVNCILIFFTVKYITKAICACLTKRRCKGFGPMQPNSVSVTDGDFPLAVAVAPAWNLALLCAQVLARCWGRGMCASPLENVAVPCPEHRVRAWPLCCKAPSQLRHKTPFVYSTPFPFLSLHSLAG